MSFSSAFASTNNLCEFSLDGKYLAYANQHKLVVRYTETYDLFHTFSCVDKIQSFQWSPDAQYILCVLCSRATVHVFSILSPSWRCKIREKETGIIQALWAPDSLHILAVAEFHVSLSIWSLSACSVSYILHPKATTINTQGFSLDGKWYAVVESPGNVEVISIFSITSWKILSQIPCPDIEDIGGLTWSPNSNILCVWSGNVGPAGCRLCFYSLSERKWVSLFKTEDFEKPFGIMNVSWSPTGQFLAIGTYDSQIRLLHHISWQKFCTFVHENVISDSSITIYTEVTDLTSHFCFEESTYEEHSGLITPTSEATKFCEVEERPVIISQEIDNNLKKIIEKTKYSHASFSYCGTYLATRNDRMPAALWIWHIPTFKQAVLLIHKNPITNFRWESIFPRIAITSGSNSVSFWSPKDVNLMMVPSSCLGTISVTKAVWHPAGKTLALCAKNKITILKLP